MKQSISLWQLVGFAFTSAAGTFLHFLYELTGGNAIAAVFSGVNESTWEHMKLLFFPMFVFAVIQSRFFKKRADFWCIKFIGTVAGLLLIPILFYTINGIFGKSPDFVNITIFFIAAAAAYLIESRLLHRGVNCRFPKLAVLCLCLLGIAFAVFTFVTPVIPLFMDPLTGTYGI